MQETEGSIVFRTPADSLN